MGFKVKALATGYYDNRRYREGQRFVIRPDGVGKRLIRDADGKVVGEEYALPRWVQPLEPVTEAQLKSAFLSVHGGHKPVKAKKNQPVIETVQVEEPEMGSASDADVI